MIETTMYDGAGQGGATMKDVAARAGVSIKTVSRVINGEVSVAADLTVRVLDAAKELGYVPNMGARSLRRSDRRTATIGVLLADVSNPFSAVLLRSMEDFARPRGVTVIAGSIDEDENLEYSLITEFVGRRVDGLMLTPVGEDLSYVAHHQRAGLPVVCLDRPPSGFNSDSVLMNNARATRDGVVHLLSYGHTRVAYIGHERRLYTSIERLRGYRAALEAAGLPFDESLVRLGAGDESFGRAATHELLDLADPPTAIFAARNSITMGAVRTLAERGLSRNVALLGFDDFPMADLLSPGVSVIAQDVRAMGKLATKILFSRIAGDEKPVRHINLEPTLIQRGTGEIHAPSVTP